MKKNILCILISSVLILLLSIINLFDISLTYAKDTLPLSNDEISPMPFDVVPNEYKLCSSAQLQIMVYGHEDISGDYLVRPDGILVLPFIGDVNCSGKTVSQITEEITDKLSAYIINPNVVINIAKLGTTRVYVLGEIRDQGLYELEKSHTLLDAVSSAGGFTEKSAKKEIYVIRQGVNNFITKVNLLELLKKGENVNIELQEGDCVYLTSNHKLSFQAVFGQISSVTNVAENVHNLTTK